MRTENTSVPPLVEGITSLDELTSLPPEELIEVLDTLLVRLRKMRAQDEEDQGRIGTIGGSGARRSNRSYPKRIRRRRSSSLRPVVGVDNNDDEVAAAAASSVRTATARVLGAFGDPEFSPPAAADDDKDGGNNKGVATEHLSTARRHRHRRRNSVEVADVSRRLHEEQGSLPKTGRPRRGSEGSVYSLDEGLDKNKKAAKKKSNKGILLAPRYSSSSSCSSDSDGDETTSPTRPLKRSNSSRSIRIETCRNEVALYAPARPPAESVEEVEWDYANDKDEHECDCCCTVPPKKCATSNTSTTAQSSASSATLLLEETVGTGTQCLACLAGGLSLTAMALAGVMQLMDGDYGVSSITTTLFS